MPQVACISGDAESYRTAERESYRTAERMWTFATVAIIGSALIYAWSQQGKKRRRR